MKERGILIVVSGFSGSGKGTLMKELLKQYDNYALSVSATTRTPRPGEVDGREYFFHEIEEFEKMIAKDELIEYAKYVENYYGTPRAYVEEQLEAGKDVILEIEIQGALITVRNSAECSRASQTSGRTWHRDTGCDREPFEQSRTGSGRHGCIRLSDHQ